MYKRERERDAGDTRSARSGVHEAMCTRGVKRGGREEGGGGVEMFGARGAPPARSDVLIQCRLDALIK